MRSFLVFALLLVSVASAGSSTRQAENPVEWSAEIRHSEKRLKKGDSFKVGLTAQIEEGWHIYSLAQPPPPKATRITLPAGQPFELNGAIETPASRAAFDENFGIDTEFY